MNATAQSKLGKVSLVGVWGGDVWLEVGDVHGQMAHVQKAAGWEMGQEMPQCPGMSSQASLRILGSHQ